MTRQQNPNLAILELAASALHPLIEELVFVGGCATGLLVTDPAAPPIRATRDVDAIVEVASLHEYHGLSQQLRELGFAEDQTAGAPVCRWHGNGVILDLMPADPAVLGFGNEHYRGAMYSAQRVFLPSGVRIRMVTAPWFLQTKLAAFDNRGGGDFVLSHDIEDIVAVIDGRPELPQEIAGAEEPLRRNLADRFAQLLDNEAFMAALPGHLLPDTSSPARIGLVVGRIRELVGRA